MSRLAKDLIEAVIESPDGVHPDDYYHVRGLKPLRKKPRIRGDLSNPTSSQVAQEPPKDYIRVMSSRGELIQGALFDFMGYLTTRPGVLELGDTRSPRDLLLHWEDWCRERGLEGYYADVEGWSHHNLSEALIDVLVEARSEWKRVAPGMYEKGKYTLTKGKDGWNAYESFPSGFIDSFPTLADAKRSIGRLDD